MQADKFLVGFTSESEWCGTTSKQQQQHQWGDGFIHGFSLINMKILIHEEVGDTVFRDLVDRTIQVISPGYTSERWPYGYRIHDELTFNDAEDFPRVVQQLINRNMPNWPERQT
jgi:hypothetical protein